MVYGSSDQVGDPENRRRHGRDWWPVSSGRHCEVKVEGRAEARRAEEWSRSERRPPKAQPWIKVQVRESGSSIQVIAIDWRRPSGSRWTGVIKSHTSETQQPTGPQAREAVTNQADAL